MNILKSIKLMGLFALAFSVVSCKVDAPKQTQTSFETMVVKKSNIVVPVKYSARLSGKADVKITPQTDGQLIKICVEEGQRVRLGQVLFMIDSRQSKLNLEEAQANLQAAIAQENSAKLEYESNKNLFEKKIVSSYMLNNALNSYNQAKAAVTQARSAVNRARVNLSYCTITSPVSGIVGAIAPSTGDQVSPGVELTTISGNESMNAEFSINEETLYSIASETVKDTKSYLQTLPEMSFIMKDGSEYEHKGKMATFTGMVDKMTGTVLCKASFPNPDGKLFSGLQGTVVIPFNMDNVMVIPQTAVVRLQDKTLVYKVNDKKCAVSAIVTVVDAETGKDVVVTSGLKPGDKIVTVGANNVREGQQVLFDDEKTK